MSWSRVFSGSSLLATPRSGCGSRLGRPDPRISPPVRRGSNTRFARSAATKKREVVRLQKKRSQALEDQLRQVRARLSSSERKLRTRRLIVLGSLMEKEFPPDTLIDKLDQALDRDQDRALFGLPPRASGGADRTPAPESAPLKGWRPSRLPDDSWGSLYVGRNPKALPPEIVGLTISVRARNGNAWNATVTEVIERSRDRILVRTRKLGQ